ncbi:unnamed protein product [Closterium sp. NIES-54]
MIIDSSDCADAFAGAGAGAFPVDCCQAESRSAMSITILSADSSSWRTTSLARASVMAGCADEKAHEQRCLSTPLHTGHSLSAPPSDESVEPSGPYPELVGCLMHLMTCTRPDLAYPLSILARYVVPERHRPKHWEAAKRALRYLCSTSGMGLVLGGRGPVVLTGHADASWVDNLATQRSSQG